MVMWCGRRYRGLILRCTVILWIVILWIWTKHEWFNASKLVVIDRTSLNELVLSMYPKARQLENVTIRSKVYDDLLESANFLEVLKNSGLRERCDLYFSQLYNSKNEWFIDPLRNFEFKKGNFKPFEEYLSDKIREHRERNKLSEDENVGTQVLNSFEEDFRKNWERIRYDEQIMHNFVAHARIFNKCYLTSDGDIENFSKRQSSVFGSFILNPKETHKNLVLKQFSCNELERRVYPWLTFKLPRYEHWDGKVYKFPKFKNLATLDETKKVPRVSNCFLENYKMKLNGKGIVLSIADKHLDLTIRLIRLLKKLGNTLPIEIVHQSSISSESKFQLVAASTTYFDGYPNQDIWFVDVSESIKSDYKHKFEGFSNKILATLFNSFQEMILVDADTVILEDPNFFFNLPKYINNGTMFFKDRYAVEYRPKSDLTFFQKLMPSAMDTAMFNFKQVTDYTLQRQFFLGSSHYMESGLVVINRNKHFTQPLIMALLNFYLPVQSRIYGDKELFWLSLVMSGDEKYSFNEHFAAAIGEVTPSEERLNDAKKAKLLKSLEVCSNHPGHISDVDNHTLLWFNSGFKQCGKKQKFEQEFESKKRYRRLKTFKSFKAFFEDKVIIRHAVIPPVDALEAPNNKDESDKAWINMRDYCSGYTWCGYSQIGAESFNEKTGETESNIAKGHFIEFNDLETEKFHVLGKVWLSHFDFRSYEQIQKDKIAADKAKENAKKKAEAKLREAKIKEAKAQEEKARAEAASKRPSLSQSFESGVVASPSSEPHMLEDFFLHLFEHVH